MRKTGRAVWLEWGSGNRVHKRQAWSTLAGLLSSCKDMRAETDSGRSQSSAVLRAWMKQCREGGTKRLRVELTDKGLAIARPMAWAGGDGEGVSYSPWSSGERRNRRKIHPNSSSLSSPLRGKNLLQWKEPRFKLFSPLYVFGSCRQFSPAVKVSLVGAVTFN